MTREFPVVEIGDSDTLSLGDRLRVIGYPGIGGETITFTEGTISGFVPQPHLRTHPPGATFDVVLASGRYDGRVIDCDGALLIEDTEGAPIDTDSILTVS